jgi:hypothetical protein
VNFQIWRSSGDEFVLLSASLVEGGYLSFAGIWGIRTKQKRDNEHAVFVDEVCGDYYYMTEKGKNWRKFKALCPELEQFEFWDENKARAGTYEQELLLYRVGASCDPYNDQLLELDKAGLKEVDVASATNTMFPPHYTGKTYTYGTLILQLPAPNNIQIAFKELARENT